MCCSAITREYCPAVYKNEYRDVQPDRVPRVKNLETLDP